MFGKSKPTEQTGSKKEPAMLLFITDGANDDRAAAAELLRQAASTSPMYFNMIGVGPAHQFGFIQQMADELPNVGFVSMETLTMSDEQLYEAVVSEEFCQWVKKQ